MANKVYVGDIGTIIEVNMQEDISSATVTQLNIKKPGGIEVTWDGEIYNNNFIRYTITDGDLDVSGLYQVAPYIEIGNWKGLGEGSKFLVWEKYQ